MLLRNDSNRQSKVNKLSKIEEKYLKFDERKELLELNAIKDQQEDIKWFIIY